MNLKEKVQALYPTEKLCDDAIMEILDDNCNVVKYWETEHHRHFTTTDVVKKFWEWDDVFYVSMEEFNWTGDYWYDSVPKRTLNDYIEVSPVKEMVEVIKYAPII